MPACQASPSHRHPATVNPPPSTRVAAHACHGRQASPDAGTDAATACPESLAAPISQHGQAPKSSPSHRHLATVGPAPQRWSIAELALGFGPGWPPTIDTPALTRSCADLASRREVPPNPQIPFQGQTQRVQKQRVCDRSRCPPRSHHHVCLRCPSRRALSPIWAPVPKLRPSVPAGRVPSSPIQDGS